MKKIIVLLLSSVLIFCFISQSLGCTIFNANQNDLVLVGNNEDWYYSSDAKVWFVPPTKKYYGRVCFGFPLKEAGWYLSFLGNFAMGGMNEQGLFVDAASCPKTKAPHFPGKPLLIYAEEEFLKRCATVDDAIKMAGEFNFPFNLSGMHLHFMVVDKNGNSAVIEWVNKELKIIKKEKSFQVITNFWYTAPELGNYPCVRYNKASEMLENNNNISITFFANILESVSQYWKNKKGNEVGTVYSNVYDLKNGKVYVYYKRDFTKPLCFNLQDELKKGRHVYRLCDLFL